MRGGWQTRAAAWQCVGHTGSGNHGAGHIVVRTGRMALFACVNVVGVSALASLQDDRISASAADAEQGMRKVRSPGGSTR